MDDAESIQQMDPGKPHKESVDAREEIAKIPGMPRKRNKSKSAELRESSVSSD